MEEWDFIDDQDLQGWKGGVVCMTCQHFAYDIDQLPHDGGLQPQAEAAPAGAAPEEAVQASGHRPGKSQLARRLKLVKTVHCELEPLKP